MKTPLILWLNQPVAEPCRRWKVIVLWLIILALTAMVFVGCSPTAVVEATTESTPVSKVVNVSTMSESFRVYVVKIDGFDYVVAVSSRGIAITPKLTIPE